MPRSKVWGKFQKRLISCTFLRKETYFLHSGMRKRAAPLICTFLWEKLASTLADPDQTQTAPEKKKKTELKNWQTVGHRKVEFQSLPGDFNSICRFHIDEILERAAFVEVFE